MYARLIAIPGGGRVTRFPFGPLNVFVYISHWAARVNSQNRPHFEGGELMVNSRSSLCNSTGSNSKQHDNVLMQNWKVMLLNLISFLHLVTPAEKDFCMVVTGTLCQSVGFPGANCDPTGVKQCTFYWLVSSELVQKLEQLERLRSEIPPAAPWLPILVIHIRSQVKTTQSQSYKF